MTLRSPAFHSRMAGIFRKRPKFFFLFFDDRFPKRVVNAPKPNPHDLNLQTGCRLLSYADSCFLPVSLSLISQTSIKSGRMVDAVGVAEPIADWQFCQFTRCHSGHKTS
jgi:hypothetical protein